MDATRRIASMFSALVLLCPAVAQAQASTVLWYRGAEGCPEGEDFLRLLGDDAPQVRLARAGDHVDFAVTFIAGEGSFSGRLERQTSVGTVAIREIDDAACDSVAGVLALGLQLALRGQSSSAAPSGEGAAGRGAPETEVDGDDGDAAASTGTHRPMTLEEQPGKPADRSASRPVASASPPHGAEPRRVLRALRVLGGMGTEQVDRPAALAGAFLDLRRSRGALFLPAARLGVLGSFAARATAEGPVDHGVLAARAEGCAVLQASDTVELWPCVGGEVGALRAWGARANGMSAGGVWAAVGAEVALHWRLASGLGLAAGGGLVAPLSRYSLTAGDRTLYATAQAGERFWAGVFLPLP